MTDSKDIHLLVITPERQILDQDVDSVVIPAHDGELGVLRGRAALMCELGIGQLRYATSGRTQRMFIDGGFAQVLDNQVTVLTNRALPNEAVTAEVVAAATRAIDEHHGHDEETRVAHEQAQRRVRVLRHLMKAST
jgi:F-type H+-transporting ATPase subunit epsilon